MYNNNAFKQAFNHQARTSSFRRCGGKSFKKAWANAFQYPPANVAELDNQYELHLYAAGYQKEDFKISIQEHVLHIAVEKTADATDNWKRKEYSLNSFERQFSLNEKVDTAAIDAQYENGVLKISLPKKTGFETKHQQINIS